MFEVRLSPRLLVRAHLPLPVLSGLLSRWLERSLGRQVTTVECFNEKRAMLGGTQDLESMSMGKWLDCLRIFWNWRFCEPRLNKSGTATVLRSAAVRCGNLTFHLDLPAC